MSLKKYYTCFALDETPHSDLHVTHKFLGNLTPYDVATVLYILSHHFSQHPFEAMEASFSREAWFGPDGKTRVLLPAEGITVPASWDSLRMSLDTLRKDDYVVWTPHVATPSMESVDGPFRRYLLCCGDEVVREYRNCSKRSHLR
jgi:hypothetical protein